MANALEDLLKAQKFDEALAGIASGELDPASAPAGIYHVAGLEDPELLRRFLAAGANPNHRSSPPPLEIAAARGRLANVEALLAAGADPNTEGFLGSALMKAIQGGFDAVAAHLVLGGAKPDTTADSPLVFAAWYNLPQALRAMIMQGYDLDGRATIDPRKLHEAAEAKKRLESAGETLSELLQKASEVMGSSDDDTEETAEMGEIQNRITAAREAQRRAAESGDDGESEVPDWIYDNAPAVVVAAGEGRRQLLELLVTADANLSTADDRGITPWAAAERGGHSELARWIEAVGGAWALDRSATENLLKSAGTGDAKGVARALENGADPNARDTRKRTIGQTPLFLAVFEDHAEVVELLLQNGAGIELRDRDENDRAAGLFGEGASPDSFDFHGVKFGLTPLALAAVMGSAESARVLIAAGADIHAVDDLGYTCTDQAVRNDHPEVLSQLLAAGAEASHAGPDGPLLIQAASNESFDCVRLLLDAGADPNCSFDQETPLHLATMVQDSDSVLALLDAGADAKRRNGDGATALELAKDYMEMESNVLDDEDEIEEALDPAVLARLEAATHATEPAGADSAVADSPDDDDWDDGEWDEDEDDDSGIPQVELPSLEPAYAAHYAFEAVHGRLRAASPQPNFQAIVAELAQRCGSAPQDFGEGLGFSLHVHSGSPLGQQDPLPIEALQAEFHPRGALVLGGGSVNHQKLLLVLPTQDPFEAVAAMGDQGVNHDITGSQVLQFFRKYPAVITDVDNSTIVGRFHPVPGDLEALAIEMYNLCPDTIDQGVGTLPALVNSLAEGRFHLWWD